MSIRHVSDVPFGTTYSVCMELGKMVNTLYMFIVISSLSLRNSVKPASFSKVVYFLLGAMLHFGLISESKCTAIRRWFSLKVHLTL
jgi:hypothetical protein